MNARRDFLRLMLLSAGASALAGCGGQQRPGLRTCPDGRAPPPPPPPTIGELQSVTDWPMWPKGMEPARCPVYVHNEIFIPAPREQVWQWLVRADLWPTWFKRASKVRFERGGPNLTLGSVVVWRMLGATIRVTVKQCGPPRGLDWEGGAGGVHAYHAWLLLEAPGGTLLITDETERGAVPSLMRLYLRRALRSAHQEWIESLALVVTCGEPPKAG